MIFSSDTNVWIDLEMLGATPLPFQSEHEFMMYETAICDEVLAPPDLGYRLRTLGLKGVDISLAEFYLAGTYQSKYKALSAYDAVALSIAASRSWVLLTGDNPLRKAAQNEGVPFKGTLGLLDLLFDEQFISAAQYKELLTRSKELPRLWWPAKEIDSRLSHLSTNK